jgi:PIN domain nuclease of toxin-antitoxin system
MNYLLDTHTFLWSLFNPDQLSAKAAQLIRNPENNITVSVVSLWEISLKYALGKLELTNILPDDLPDAAQQLGLDILPLESKEAATFYRLPHSGHKDPFDRLIVWQAIQHKMTLISKDAMFGDYRKIGLKNVW